METIKTKSGMGWLPDYPDFRDYTIEQQDVSMRLREAGQKDSIKTMLAKIGVKKQVKAQSSSVDLREWCSPIEDQGSLGSCTANACAGIVEYFERKAFGKHVDGSRLFLYKVTRNLLNQTGDTGAYLRSTMGALVMFGIPPEEYWKYNIDDFDKEPSSFCYSMAQNYKAVTYFRLDTTGISKDVLLKQIKTNLAAGIPSMFGFTVYDSISQAGTTGKIPFPTTAEKIAGGHAIGAFGYDDNFKIKNSNRGGKETKGALLIRNSWGKSWGDNGYGWLPYEYVLQELAIDWWTLLKNEWVNTGEFGL